MRRLTDLLVVNWELKLTALMLAFLLWLAVHGDPSGEKIITVPLEIHNTPRDLVITNERTTAVELTIRGSLGNAWFGGALPSCVINLEGAEEGERIVPLTATNLRIPRGAGLEVVAIQPPRVRLVLEKTESKSVPIRAATEAAGLPADLEVYSISVSPSTVVLTGPRSHIVPLKEVSTEAITLAGQKESLRTFVHLNIPDAMIHTTPVRPVEAYVEIGPRRKLRLITEVPVVAEDGEITVTPSKVSLRVLVPIGYKGSLTGANFSATVSLRNVDPSTVVARVRPEVNPTSQLDPAVRITEVIPALVTVRRAARGSDVRGRG